MRLRFPALGGACLSMAALACSSAQPAPDDAAPLGFTSGARLRAHYYDASGGAKQLIDFFDTELQVPCTFGRAADGRWRCLPAASPADRERYFDASCTQPALQIAPGRNRAWSLGATGPGTCLFGASTVYAPTSVTTAVPTDTVPATLYAFGTSCEPVAPEPGAAYGAPVEMAPDRFVAANEVVVTRGPLAARVLVAEDGASVVFGLRDVARGADCEPRFDRCLPLDTGFLAATDSGPPALFDPTCTTPIDATVWSAGCPAPSLLLRQPHEDFVRFVCDATRALFAPSPTTVSEMAGNTCTPLGNGVTAYAAGAPLADDLPHLAYANVGDGPVKARSYANDEGVSLGRSDPDWSFDDAARGVPCTVMHAADGSARCIDADVLFMDRPLLFEDDACTVPMVDAYAADCSSGSGGPPAVWTASDGSIVDAAPTKPITPARSWSLEGGACVGGQPATAPRYFEIGPHDMAVLPRLDEKSD